MASVIAEHTSSRSRAARSYFYVGVSVLIVATVPVLAGMAYDLRRRGRIHPVYWIGAAAMGLALLRIPFGGTEVWNGISRRLLLPLI